MTLTPEQLAEARALASSAPARISQVLGHGGPTDNEVFYAAARSLVPALLDDVAALRQGLREALRWLEPSTGIDDPRWRAGGMTASELVPRFTEIGGAKLVDAVAALRQLLEGK